MPVVEKSLKKNFALDMIRTLLSIIFPLISFPYASRVLGITGIGTVAYTESIIGYFSLFAGLGIASYGAREGARVRDNKEKLNKLTTELLILNLGTCFLSYLALGAFLQIPMFKKYCLLLVIQSAVLFFNTVGMDWIYTVFEEYGYIAIRQIIFQIISLLCLFVFVKTEKDYIIYAAINVLASSGIGITNFFHARKYVRLFQCKTVEIKKHIRPVVMIFGTSLASSIYMNLDTTMLGAIKGEAAVGLYAAAVKLNKVVCNVLASLSTVLLPRMAYYLKNGREKEYHEVIGHAMNITCMLAIPACIGMACVSRNIIVIFSGEAFETAYIASIILAFNIVLTSVNRILVWQVLMPMDQEKYVMITTILGAVVNFGLNLFFIYVWSERGAAFTTIVAESCVLVMSLILCRKRVNLKDMFRRLPQYILAAVSIIPCAWIIMHLVSSLFLSLIITIVTGVVVYFCVLVFMKNPYVHELVGSLKKKL